MKTYTPSEARKLWVDALRSGNYTQGQEFLHLVKPEDKMCCLGVACDIYEKYVTPLPKQKTPLDGTNMAAITYDGAKSVLPPKVADWLGLRAVGGNHTTSDGTSVSLWELNDDQRLTFSEIADVIEKEPEGLLKR